MHRLFLPKEVQERFARNRLAYRAGGVQGTRSGCVWCGTSLKIPFVRSQRLESSSCCFITLKIQVVRWGGTYNGPRRTAGGSRTKPRRL